MVILDLTYSVMLPTTQTPDATLNDASKPASQYQKPIRKPKL